MITPLKRKPRLKWATIAPVMAGLGVVGIVVVIMASAAGTPVAFEAESGVRAGSATLVTPSGASGTGAVKFGAAVTPTPTPTPGGFQANCIASPHVCGYPDETNTGVPAGATLTRVPEDATSGPGWGWRSDIRAVTIGDAGAVVQNLQINQGFIIIYDGNVTLRNIHLITSDLYPIDCDYGGATRAAGNCLGLTIEDSEVEGTSLNCLVGIAFGGYTARRTHLHGCQDGFKAEKDVLIEDSYVHNLASDGGGTHNDAVQTTGGSNVTLRHNTFKLGDMPDANAVVQFGTEHYPTITNWLIENNLADGGGWTFNANPPVTSSIVRNNRFTRRYLYGISDMVGATWTGNYFDDTGAPVNH